MYENKFPPSLVCKDGTQVKLCPLERTKGIPIYCSKSGLFFSFASGVLRQVRPYVNRHFKCKRNVHSDYPKLQYYLGNARCHMLMAITWLEPKPEKNYVVDHINGNIFDWSLDNLQWITPTENHKRAVILRARRMVARQDNDPSKLPENMKPEELLALFSKYNVAGDVYEGE